MYRFSFLKPFFFLFASLFLVSACEQPAQEAQAPEQSLTEFLNEATVTGLKESPESVTFLGLSDELVGYKTGDKLDDRSPAAEQRGRELFKETVEGLLAYDRSALEGDERLYYDIATTVNRRATPLLSLQSPFSPNFPQMYRITQLSGPHLNIPNLLLAQHPMNTKQDAEDFVARVNQINEAMHDFVTTWQQDLAAGIVPPKFAMEKISATIGGFIAEEPTESVFYQTFAKRLAGIEGLSEEEQNQLLAACEDAVVTSAVPGYAHLKEAVDAALPNASEDAGVWAQPNGETFYGVAVKVFGDTTLTPEQIHDLGLSEVERISAEADAIFDSLGMTEGTVGERFAALSEDPGQTYPNTEEGREQLLAFLRENHELIVSKVPDYFAVVPESGVEIRPVPKFSEATSPGGYYTPPSIEGGRPGIFWINLRDTTEQQLWTLKSLLYHEAVPGHHFELARAIEAEERPLFRRLAFFSNFSEGWALYAERLASEMGAYEGDPYGDLGRLQAELFRAVRLVVDTGMHAKRWTREQAIDYMASTTGTPRPSVVTEIERYAVWPGQALGYKMGMLKILELREQARQALGDGFDIKAFHELILGKGAMPMSVVESRVAGWMAEQAE